jgi:uridine kinase
MDKQGLNGSGAAETLRNAAIPVAMRRAPTRTPVARQRTQPRVGFKRKSEPRGRDSQRPRRARSPFPSASLSPRSSTLHPPSLPLFVAIVGGSGAGKTWLAKKLRSALDPDATRLSLDDFYRDCSRIRPERRERMNFDHPRAIDWPVMQEVLDDLRAGRAARLPGYDFKNHCRLAARTSLACKPVVLVDGLWLLHRRSLRRVFDLKIFIDCPARRRRGRRLVRDLRSRGRTRASVLEQLKSTVEPMHDLFVAPQQKWADVVLRHNFGAREIRRLARHLRERLDGLRSTQGGKGA